MDRPGVGSRMKSRMSPQLRSQVGVWVLRVIAASAGVVMAVLAFNLVVMPMLVRQGQQVEVPALEGLSTAEAVETLAEAGLAVRDTLERPNDAVEAGRIMDQVPPAGNAVKPGRSVRLLVSRGGEKRLVPPTAGESMRTARVALGNAGYGLGNVVKVHSERVQEGYVVASDPPPGTQLPQGQRVHLLVSSGPAKAPLALPDLRGLRLSKVEEQLRAAGFKVQSQRGMAPNNYRELLRVVDTQPGPGAKVYLGDPIVLIGG